MGDGLSANTPLVCFCKLYRAGMRLHHFATGACLQDNQQLIARVVPVMLWSPVLE